MPLRLKHLLLATLIWGISAPVWAGEPTQFFEGLPDVPIMQGLSEQPQDAYVFDKPEGRIAETSAIAEKLTRADIESYYAQALPQFGWNPLKASRTRYQREEEELSLFIDEAQGKVFVQITVGPRG